MVDFYGISTPPMVPNQRSEKNENNQSLKDLLLYG